MYTAKRSIATRKHAMSHARGAQCFLWYTFSVANILNYLLIRVYNCEKNLPKTAESAFWKRVGRRAIQGSDCAVGVSKVLGRSSDLTSSERVGVTARYSTMSLPDIDASARKFSMRTVSLTVTAGAESE